MDKSEYLALGIVAIAAIVWVRGFFKKSKSNCCPTSCDLKTKKPQAPEQAPERPKEKHGAV